MCGLYQRHRTISANDTCTEKITLAGYPSTFDVVEDVFSSSTVFMFLTHSFARAGECSTRGNPVNDSDVSGFHELVSC